MQYDICRIIDSLSSLDEQQSREDRICEMFVLQIITQLSTFHFPLSTFNSCSWNEDSCCIVSVNGASACSLHNLAQRCYKEMREAPGDH